MNGHLNDGKKHMNPVDEWAEMVARAKSESIPYVPTSEDLEDWEAIESEIADTMR